MPSVMPAKPTTCMWMRPKRGTAHRPIEKSDQQEQIDRARCPWRRRSRPPPDRAALRRKMDRAEDDRREQADAVGRDVHQEPRHRHQQRARAIGLREQDGELAVASRQRGRGVTWSPTGDTRGGDDAGDDARRLVGVPMLDAASADFPAATAAAAGSRPAPTPVAPTINRQSAALPRMPQQRDRNRGAEQHADRLQRDGRDHHAAARALRHGLRDVGRADREIDADADADQKLTEQHATAVRRRTR